MTELAVPSRCLRSVIAGAFGAEIGPKIAKAGLRPIEPSPVGTEHLLLGALFADSPVARALRRLGVTKTSVMAIVRHRAQGDAGWNSDEGASPAPDAGVDRLLAEVKAPRDRSDRARRPKGWSRARRPKGWKRVTFTPAARRALRTAIDEAIDKATNEANEANEAAEAVNGAANEVTEKATGEATAAEVTGDHVLVGLLADPASHAAEVLATLGVEREVALRSATAALRGEPVDPPPAAGAELDADLRFTRAVLLGQATYTPSSGRQRLLLGMADRFCVNWAELPWWWAVFDGQEHARRLGHPTVGSEHLLLGIAATHEVAHAHPQLLPDDVARRYTGGAALAEAGVTHQLLKQTLVSTMDATSRRAGLDQSDAGALREVGIDLDEIIARAERSFGPGALSTQGGGRRGALAAAIRRWRPKSKDPQGITGELLATILANEDSGAWRLLVAAGADPERIRRGLDQRSGS